MRKFNIKCSIVRGGTTKGIYIDSRQLPDNPALRDKVILSLFGSPDLRQINGLGGADPLTSKIAFVLPSSHSDADIDYMSGEVGIDEASINYSTMCGNLASGAAIFAYHSGMIPVASTDTVSVRIRNLNTHKFLTAEFSLTNELPSVEHCEDIDGVPGFGTRVKLGFVDPEGSITGRLLPTGTPCNILTLKSRDLKASIVDCGTLYTFICASDLGLTGSEAPEAIDANAQIRSIIEEARACVAELISTALKQNYSEKQIKIALIGETQAGTSVPEANIRACVINKFKTHKAYPVTGAICLSAAAAIPGTVVNLTVKHHFNDTTVKIAHPGGIIETSSKLDSGATLKIFATTISRSARLLMEGSATAYIEEHH